MKVEVEEGHEFLEGEKTGDAETCRQERSAAGASS
jgi:hypothetical protein